VAQKTPSTRKLETVVTYLEMRRPPGGRVEPPANIKLMLVKADKPPVHFYRYLYNAVGERHYWVDRRNLSDAALARLIHAKGVQVFVLYVAGAPAGYFEIDARRAGVAEIKYFGLIPDFQGRGLGRWFLAEAVAAAWAASPERVIVDTCTLDGRAALLLYQRSGFVPYAREHKVLEVPTPEQR
jgi:GNAT superfamily N-acetyltransferase